MQPRDKEKSRGGRLNLAAATLYPATLVEAVVVIVADDNVIQHGNPAQFTGGDKAPRDLDIVNCRSPIARGMMADDRARRIRKQRCLEDIARMNDRSTADLVIRDKPVLGG